MPVPSRSQLVVYALVVGMVVLLGGRVLRASSAGRGNGGAGAPAAGAAAPRGTTAFGAAAGSRGSGTAGVEVQQAQGGAALVHVAGAVRRPGVYRLREGDRVRDAVARAGGRARGGDVDAINLAAKVADGQRIVVPARVRAGAPGTSPAGAAAGAGGPAGAAAAAGAAGVEAPPVDLNAATLEQLDTLDGIGPAIAARILAWREQHGGFRSVDDLGQIPGIGPKRLEALRARVLV